MYIYIILILKFFDSDIWLLIFLSFFGSGQYIY